MYVLVKYFIYNNTIMELDQEKGRKWSQILPAFVGKKKLFISTSSAIDIYLWVHSTLDR